MCTFLKTRVQQASVTDVPPTEDAVECPRRLHSDD